MKEELKKLNAEFAFRAKRSRELCDLLKLNEADLARIREAKRAFYLPPPPPFDLPKDIMPGNEWAKVMKMARAKEPCEYCGLDEVRSGKKFDLCTECGHCKPK